MKLFKCKYCREKKESHELSSRLPQVCKSIDCIKKKYDEFKEKVHAKAKVNLKVKSANEKKVEKEKLKTHKDYLKDLQKVFNEFIRKRDEKLPCVSCGTNDKNKQYDCGHFRSVGANPELRFEELNCWRQCRKCNSYWGGNLLEYRKELIKRIGVENVEWLEGSHPSNKLSIQEIKEKIIYYKEKIKTYDTKRKSD